MRAALTTLVLLIGMIDAAQADCLQEVSQFRDSLDEAKPTPQTKAAAKELQKLEAANADEADCVNSLVRAKKLLAAPVPADDRYAKEHHQP